MIEQTVNIRYSTIYSAVALTPNLRSHATMHRDTEEYAAEIQLGQLLQADRSTSVVTIDAGAADKPMLSQSTVVSIDEKTRLHSVRREISSEGDIPDGSNSGSNLDKELSTQGVSSNLSDPINIVIHCPEDIDRMDRFRRHMQQANLTFEVFPCVHPSLTEIHQAVGEGLYAPSVEGALGGAFYHSGTLGVGLAHMRLLQNIVKRSLPAVNIFEDDEVVPGNYYSQRRKILANLPTAPEFVNFNALRATGDTIDGADSRILKAKPGPRKSPMYNVWLSNYFVSAEGAKKVLKIMRGFDMGPQGQDEIDWRVAEGVASGAVDGYVLKTNSLSLHCELQSTKRKNDQEGTSFAEEDDPCGEM